MAPDQNFNDLHGGYKPDEDKADSIPNTEWVKAPDGKYGTNGKVVQRWLIRPVACGNRPVYRTAVMIKGQMTYNKSDSHKNLLEKTIHIIAISRTGF